MEILIITALLTILSQTSYIAYKQLSSHKFGQDSVLLDTSVLIDGRITAIAESGLISAKLIVPRSVVRELQFMADRADHAKRERARFGLDIIEKLRQLKELDLEVKDDGVTSQLGVDEQLINLAKDNNAKLCTIDYNLNKAATVQGVTVININELAHALRIIHLPGEKIDIIPMQVGQEKKQAVGYLDDGTMVVIDSAQDKIGQTITIELTRVLQTAAGRMMFAKIVSGVDEKSHKTDTKTSRPQRTPAKASRKPKSQYSQSSRSSHNHNKRSPEAILVDLAQNQSSDK